MASRSRTRRCRGAARCFTLERETVGIGVIGRCRGGSNREDIEVQRPRRHAGSPLRQSRAALFSQDSAPFGKSGFCHWTDDTRIGASCSCERTVEHAHEEHWGLVIEAPIGNGSSSSVH